MLPSSVLLMYLCSVLEYMLCYIPQSAVQRVVAVVNLIR
jgi:hypothetical protein